MEEKKKVCKDSSDGRTVDYHKTVAIEQRQGGVFTALAVEGAERVCAPILLVVYVGHSLCFWVILLYACYSMLLIDGKGVDGRIYCILAFGSSALAVD